jgi:hypothetical protein
VVRHRASLLFASFQGQSVSQIALPFQVTARRHVAELTHAFQRGELAQAIASLRRGPRPRRYALPDRCPTSLHRLAS